MEHGTVNWTKPSGMEITTNDFKATVEHCERLGWQREAEELTVEMIGAMTIPKLKGLIKEYELTVDDTLKVAELRVAVIAAMSAPVE